MVGPIVAFQHFIEGAKNNHENPQPG